MQILRLYDPARRPPGWMQIVKPGQFALFAKDLDSDVPCDVDGRGFADPEQGTCVVFDGLEEARAFAEAAAARTPALRVDIFDAQGRANPPLLTLVHPSRAGEADTHPRVQGRRSLIAWALIAIGLPLIGFAYVERNDRDIILPAFVGINMIIAAGRLLWFNLAVRETERVRQDRVRQHESTSVTRPREH